MFQIIVYIILLILSFSFGVFFLQDRIEVLIVVLQILFEFWIFFIYSLRFSKVYVGKMLRGCFNRGVKVNLLSLFIFGRQGLGLVFRGFRIIDLKIEVVTFWVKFYWGCMSIQGLQVRFVILVTGIMRDRVIGVMYRM